MACLQEQTTVACKKPVLNNPFVAQTTGKSPASQGNGQVAGQGTAPNAGNGLLQINAGPGALAMSMIFEAMDLYASIINLQKQQRVAMINTQADSAQAQADETIAEGKAGFEAALVAGSITIGMAVGSLVAYKVADMKFGGSSKEDFERLNTKLTPMQGVEGNLEEKPFDLRTGQHSEYGASQDVADRMSEFKNHEYEKGAYTEKQIKAWKKDGMSKTEIEGRVNKRNADTKEAVRRLKTINRAADDTEGFDYNEWKEGFYKRYDAGRQESLSITQRQGTVAQYANMASQLFTSAGGAGSQVVTAYGQQVQAKHRAAASLDQVSSSMAGGNSQESAQAMSKAADAQSQEVQILREIDRANSVA